MTFRSHNISVFASTFILLLTSAAHLCAADITVDCAKTIGTIRPLQGGNDGPIQFGGLIDLSAYHREIGVPYTRLHDCRWPNGNVVDMHVVFPNAKADPALPESYDFARTDECIDSVFKTGSRVIYRLGESIEHTPRQYHVHPPADVDHWAAQCVGIIRHYNEGWANGRHDNIVLWEIWNEPENRPRCFTGTDEDYFRLYAATARAIKSRWPALKVGGPAVGYTGKIVDGQFQAGEFLLKFLDYCKGNSLPLDFFSWHLYSNDPGEYLVRAKGIRAILDQHGFAKTELHLNEWNYLPDNQWLTLDPTAPGDERDRYFARATGAEAAAFIAGVLITLQDSPVDVANFFPMNNQPSGSFSELGTPHKNFYAFKAFRGLLDMSQRLPITGDNAKLLVCAGINADRTRIVILISNRDAANQALTIHLDNLPWANGGTCELITVDGEHDFSRESLPGVPQAPGTLGIRTSAPGCYLLSFRAGKLP